MSNRNDVYKWAEEADSLAESIETADSHDVSTDTLARVLAENIWNHDIPHDRGIKIIQKERDRLKKYENISLSASARAPRYMDITDLDLVSGYEFEYVLAEILRRVEGESTVTEASGDQGLDVVWFRETTTIGIQAKAYDTTNPVGNSAVQEIYTGATVRHAEYSIDTPAVVTTSHYTTGAKEAAETSDVVLYDRSHLKQWLAEAELDAESMGNLLEDIH